MKILVLTGGTLGGKTTIIKNLKGIFKEKIIVVPEVSSLLFANEFKRPKKWTLQWHYSLQEAILSRQKKLEDEAKIQAREEDVKLIICDRGMLDPAAYLEGGLSELIKQFGVNEKQALMRYNQVIHLVSLSVLNPSLYNHFVSTNPYRVETLSEAQKQEHGTLDAWKNHHNRIIFSNNIKDNMKKVLEIVQSSLMLGNLKTYERHKKRV
ncbi:MAG: AAA family ATPase [Parcubacteria group bacterium]